jgi:hypothetical protein
LKQSLDRDIPDRMPRPPMNSVKVIAKTRGNDSPKTDAKAPPATPPEIARQVKAQGKYALPPDPAIRVV